MYSAEKALKEHGEKVSEDIRKNVQEKIDALKTARTQSDEGAIKSASDALNTAMSAIGEAMSKNTNTPPQQEGQKPNDDNTTTEGNNS